MSVLNNITNKTNDDPWLIDQYRYNRVFHEPTYTVLILVYIFPIIFGALGNTLVIISVIRKPAMQTPRNMFILNLAVADFLLCTFTMPLTLMELVTKFFPLGDSLFLCKIIAFMQATSAFVSTISITAIALDRYQVIVYPTKLNLQLFGAALVLLLIWVVAIILALPLYIVKELNSHKIVLDDEPLQINYCIESWPIHYGRAYYSIFTLVFQYTLPILIISAAYIRISFKLRYRFSAGFVSGEDSSQNCRRQLRERRLQRTNLLLGSIAVIFFISWLPLNLFNLIADLHPIDFNYEPVKLIFAVCHMMGMSSSCLNPILYGCLNDNFWNEFKEILCIESRVSGNGGESQRLSLRKQTQKVFGRSKPDLVTGATDYQPCNTASTDMTVLTKC